MSMVKEKSRMEYLLLMTFRGEKNHGSPETNCFIKGYILGFEMCL